MDFLKFINKLFISILCGFFKKTKNNYDFYRFPKIEKKSLRQYFYWFIEISFLLIYIKKFFKSYQLLKDQESKELFIKLIVYKTLGWKRVQIKNNCDWSDERQFLLFAEQFFISPSTILFQPHPLLGNLNHYENIPTESGDISLDCWPSGIAYLAIKKQYYFERNNITIRPESGDVIIDAGGCFGDTSIFFAKSAGKEGKVYVFDPLSAHGEVINKNIMQNNLEKQVTYLPYAVSELSNHAQPKAGFEHGLNPGFRLQDDSSFPMISIDDFMKNYSVSKIDFIKMDIEGHELSALKGAIQTIRKFKPKLAISLYHRKEDFYAIPLWISQIIKDYHFYIDHYSLHAEETVLYAIPSCRKEK